MFIDVDTPPPPGCFSKGQADQTAERQQAVRAHIEQVVQQIDSVAVELYRTAGGYRLLIGNLCLEPDDPRSKQLMQAFHGDQLYVHLCRRQHCYRARLSPKPWRLGLEPAGCSVDQTPDADWLHRYQEAARSHCVCHHLGHLGPPSTLESAQRIRAIHDQRCCQGEHVPLA